MVAVAAELVEVRRMQPTQQRNVLRFVAKNKFRMACACVCAWGRARNCNLKALIKKRVYSAFFGIIMPSLRVCKR